MDYDFEKLKDAILEILGLANKKGELPTPRVFRLSLSLWLSAFHCAI